MAGRDETERQKRRAANLIWNAAGSYDFKPFIRAFDEDGRADLYMNSVIGAVHRYLELPPLLELFSTLGGGERAEDYEELIWLGLEGRVYDEARDERPAMESLRREYARSVLELLSRRDPRDLTETERLRRAHFSGAVGEQAELTEREHAIADGLTFPAGMGSDEIARRADETLRRYYAFVPRREIRRAIRLPGWLRPRRSSGTGLSSDSDEEESQGGSLPRLRAFLRGERTESESREYLERCFGLPALSPERSEELEREVCAGAHAGCRLHITRGVYGPEPVRDTETALHRSRDASRERENRQSYAADIAQNRTEIARLSDRIRNTLLVYLDPSPVKSRAGCLRPERVWRAERLGDDAVFSRPERGEAGDLKIDLLLDASASQQYRIQSVSSQARILTESLDRCGIPVRVSSFCSVEGSTVLRILRDYGETGRNDAVFAYSTEGWNRDGLALRAVGSLIDGAGAESRLLIVLSDAAPNDSARIGGTRCAYAGENGVRDAAAEVDALRRRGVPVVCVFTGEESSLPAARAIYGRDLACIRYINQFADAVGSIVCEKLRAM